MTNWDEYNDESEEYIISASLGYSLYNSLVDLQTNISTLEDTVSGLQTQIDELDTSSGGGGSGGTASTSEVAKKLETARSLWGQSFDGTQDVNGNIHIETMN